jgi:hypothetical protein
MSSKKCEITSISSCKKTSKKEVHKIAKECGIKDPDSYGNITYLCEAIFNKKEGKPYSLDYIKQQLIDKFSSEGFPSASACGKYPRELVNGVGINYGLDPKEYKNINELCEAIIEAQGGGKSSKKKSEKPKPKKKEKEEEKDEEEEEEEEEEEQEQKRKEDEEEQSKKTSDFLKAKKEDCDMCKLYLQNKNINSAIEYKKWMLKYHPDRIEKLGLSEDELNIINQEVKDVTACYNIVFGKNKDECEKYEKGETPPSSPKPKKKAETPPSSPKPQKKAETPPSSPKKSGKTPSMPVYASRGKPTADDLKEFAKKIGMSLTGTSKLSKKDLYDKINKFYKKKYKSDDDEEEEEEDDDDEEERRKEERKKKKQKEAEDEAEEERRKEERRKKKQKEAEDEAEEERRKEERRKKKQKEAEEEAEQERMRKKKQKEADDEEKAKNASKPKEKSYKGMDESDIVIEIVRSMGPYSLIVEQIGGDPTKSDEKFSDFRKKVSKKLRDNPETKNILAAKYKELILDVLEGMEIDEEDSSTEDATEKDLEQERLREQREQERLMEERLQEERLREQKEQERLREQREQERLREQREQERLREQREQERLREKERLKEQQQQELSLMASEDVDIEGRPFGYRRQKFKKHIETGGLPYKYSESADKLPPKDWSVEDILDELQEKKNVYLCDPKNKVFCPENFTCDLSSKPSSCLENAKVDQMKKFKNLVEWEYEGKKIIGSKDAEKMFKSSFSKKEGDVIQEDIDLNKKYKKESYVIVMEGKYKDEYGQIKNIDNNKKLLEVLLIEQDITSKFKPEEVQLVSEDQYMEYLNLKLLGEDVDLAAMNKKGTYVGFEYMDNIGNEYFVIVNKNNAKLEFMVNKRTDEIISNTNDMLIQQELIDPSMLDDLSVEDQLETIIGDEESNIYSDLYLKKYNKFKFVSVDKINNSIDVYNILFDEDEKKNFENNTKAISKKELKVKYEDGKLVFDFINDEEESESEGEEEEDSESDDEDERESEVEEEVDEEMDKEDIKVESIEEKLKELERRSEKDSNKSDIIKEEILKCVGLLS